MAAAIEQNHDAKGIVFPAAIAPFTIAIAPIHMHKSATLRAAAEALYVRLKAEGLDVLFYDRNERPGVMFADLELIGIPHRLVLGDRGLERGTVEYKGRTDETAQDLPLEEAIALIKNQLLAG